MKILMVDDSPFEMIETVPPLQREGWEVELVTSITEAIPAARKLVNGDVLMVDMIMPRTEEIGKAGSPIDSGMDFLRLILPKLPQQVGILAFTVVKDPQLIGQVKSLLQGRSSEILTKPMLPRRMITSIKNLMGLPVKGDR